MPGISLKTLHNVCFKGIPRISVTKPSPRLATNQKFLTYMMSRGEPMAGILLWHKQNTL